MILSELFLTSNTIDWKQFRGAILSFIKEYIYIWISLLYDIQQASERYIGPWTSVAMFSLERFFRWRCWWDS